MISYIFGYKLREGTKVGFPETSIEKVKAKLEEFNISYVIHIRDEKPYKKLFRMKNKYDEYFFKAQEKISNKEKIDLIISKIEDAPYEKLCGIIEVLDEYLGK